MINGQIDIFLPISDANMNAYFKLCFTVDYLGDNRLTLLNAF